MIHEGHEEHEIKTGATESAAFNPGPGLRPKWFRERAGF